MTEVTEPAAVTEPPVATEPPAGTEPPVAPEWTQTLPDDLKSDATITRFKTIEDLARGHIEAHKTVKTLQGSKLLLPGEGATEEDWGKVFDALGRPETPDGYDIKTVELPVDAPDEARAALAESTKPFRELAHKLGLNANQATALSQWTLELSAADRAKGDTEVAAIKARLGADYEPKRAAAYQVMKQIFGGDAETLAMLNEFDGKLGTKRLVEGMLRLGEIAGEAKLIDDDKVEGFGDVADAQAKLTELQGDKTWREKLNAGDTTVVQQRKHLLELAARQAQRRGNG